MAYSEKEKTDIINSICERIEEGESLRSVLKGEDMPHHATFFSWIDNNKEQLSQYVRACEGRAESIFEDMFDIADSQESDIITLEDGREVTNHDVIQRARLRVDTRKWILSKMQPKKYGDKLDVLSSDGSMTPQKSADLSKLTKDTLKRMESELDD